MATGIMILGSSGAGKTTLGKIVAEKLGFVFVDIDDYIWRKNTKIPFSEMYSREEKINRLMNSIANCEHFVMAGSMNSFHEYFDPFFELVIHLHADEQVRVKRAHERELELFKERILEGGDMYEEHQKFLESVVGYDRGVGNCTLQQHEMWLQSLQCEIIRLDGTNPLEENAKRIISTYWQLQ